MAKKQRELNFNPNYLFYWMLMTFIRNRDAIDTETGERGLIKFFNFGGTRSGKTFDAIHLIIKFIDAARDKNKKLKVIVYRSTLTKVREITLDDFKKCFEIIGLINGVDYKLTGDSQNGKPIITINGSEIKFLGMEDEIEPGFTDIIYFNEILETNKKRFFDQTLRKCTRLAIIDSNPSLTEHFAFHYKKSFNTFYSNTTYLDNPKVSSINVAEVKATCPWDFRDSDIETYDYDEEIGDGFRRLKWLKPERPESMTAEMDVNNEYRRDNKTNVERNTANRANWLIYGEGISAPMEGAVFRDVHWIDEFPKDDLDYVNFSLDFGYNNDPSVLVKAGVNGRRLYSECLLYQCTKTPEILFYLILPTLQAEYDKRKAFAEKYKLNYVDEIVVACDSSDKYGETEFVYQLRLLAIKNGLDWLCFDKVKKMRIVERINLMQKFDMYIVKNEDVSKEQQNYVFEYEVKHGKSSNKPVDEYNHFWDALGYNILHFLLDYIDF